MSDRFCELGRSVAVSPRTETGVRGVYLPSTGLTEYRRALGGCRSCAKRLAHGPPSTDLGVDVPGDEGPYDRMPAGTWYDATELTRLWDALYRAMYFAFGVDVGVLWNQGAGANNHYNEMRCEVLEVDGAEPRRVKLRMPQHPGGLVFGNSIVNPEWPGVDENGDPLPRLISLGVGGSLPLGGLCRFHYPSCFHEKITPRVERVECPLTGSGETDVWVWLSYPVSYCMEPVDLKYPPGDGKYWCTLYFFFVNPIPGPNFQEWAPRRWSRRIDTPTVAELEAVDGVWELYDNGGGSCRVLWPGMVSGAVTVSVVRQSASYTWPEAQVLEHLVTEDLGSGWRTRLDLSGELDVEPADLLFVRVAFYPEAVSSDAVRYPFAGRCANSQVDYSGSYIHDETSGRRCTNTTCSKFRAGTFRGECWDPAATGFCLGTEHVAYEAGRMEEERTDLRVNEWGSRFWSDIWWVINQPIVSSSGARAFTLDLVGGASLLGLVGGHNERVPGGLFSRREAFYSPVWGQLDVWEDEEGEHHEVVHGLYLKAVTQDCAERQKIGGLLFDTIADWWYRDDDLGEQLVVDVANYPNGGVGNSGLYSYRSGGDGRAVRSRLSEIDEERYVVAVDVGSAEDEGVAEMVRRVTG